MINKTDLKIPTIYLHTNRIKVNLLDEGFQKYYRQTDAQTDHATLVGGKHTCNANK